MNKKMIFRVLGALASGLIIASVFVPFVSISGYTRNLWNEYQSINSLYLPIMIICFGGLSALFFALNIRTEFAYMTTGAILFFGIIETVEFINQEAFSTASIGYYFLIVGAILVGIFAYLSGTKEKTVKIESTTNEEVPSMLNQIDRLYSDVQDVNNTVAPQPIQPIEPMQPQINIEQAPVVQPMVQEPIQQVAPMPVQNEPVAPVEPQPVIQPTIQEPQQVITPVQPAVSIPEMPVQTNPIPTQPVNPVVAEFSNPIPQPEIPQMAQPIPDVQPINVATPIPEIPSEPVAPNPVVQQFTGESTTNKTDNNAGLDIFGQ